MDRDLGYIRCGCGVIIRRNQPNHRMCCDCRVDMDDVIKERWRRGKRIELLKLLGGKCFFHDFGCSGSLEFGHKVPTNSTRKYRYIGPKRAEDYILLCQRHNNIVHNIPIKEFEIHLEHMLSCLRNIKLEIYSQDR